MKKTKQKKQGTWTDGRTDGHGDSYIPSKYEPHKTNESKHEPNIILTCESYQHHSTERDNM